MFTPTTTDIIHAGLEDIDTALDAVRSLQNSAMPPDMVKTLFAALATACAPDTALRNLVGIVRTQYGLGHNIFADMTGSGALNRLVAVLGASDAMGTMMRFRPALVEAAAIDRDHTYEYTRSQRRDHLLKAIGVNASGQGAPESTASLAESTAALRRTYYDQLAAIMARDLCSSNPIDIQPRISGKLSDLADAALEGALCIARHEVDNSDLCRFAVIAMGKLGAQELNYVSDVDLIYVVEPTDSTHDINHLIRIGTKLATTLQRVCQSTIAQVSEPALWQIDGALRPEGKDGPLVRRLDSHRQYYEHWAQNWEFQALLKARAAAGDERLGGAYVDMTRPLVWSASHRENFVNDCQAMRQRVEQLIPESLKDREVKLGKGGLRDVEFTVQMLQLVHGRSDKTLRTAATLHALHALSEGGYVSRNQASKLSVDYRFERVIEHRQQMWALKRTHLFPAITTRSDAAFRDTRDRTVLDLGHNTELRRLARAFAMHPEDLVKRFREVRNEIRRLHMDIYYRPMLPINAQLEDDQIELTHQAAQDRFASIGFADTDSAMRHVSVLTSGLTRAAKINRILLPSVLQWLGQGQNPDMGLLNWRRLEERFGEGSPYLGFLRDSPMAAQRLCHILSNSRFLGDALTKSVESITWLGDDARLRPRGLDSLEVQCRATMNRYAQDMEDFSNSLRAMRRQEIERIGLAWSSGVMHDDECLTAMTNVYDAIINSAVQWAVRRQCQAYGLGHAPAAIAVIAMGRYGGGEVNFSSDADAIIIYRPTGEQDVAGAFARAVVDELRTILQGPSSMEPKIDLDLDLRPEGKNGPLARSYASCREYYAHWASTWEHQALLRARYAAGDRALADAFLHDIADPLRYPRTAPDVTEMSEIRTLKARMEAERLPRGVRRERHLKLGKGGLSDVEWTVQSLQLQYAGKYPKLRVTATIPALDELESLGLLGADDAAILRRAWKVCTAARNGNYLWTGRSSRADIIADDLDSLGGVAVYLGYEAHSGQYFENDLLSVMRKCRDVVERLFYGR